jgi:hypothetical protein
MQNHAVHGSAVWNFCGLPDAFTRVVTASVGKVGSSPNTRSSKSDLVS